MLEPSSSLLADLEESISLTNDKKIELFRLYPTTSFGVFFLLGGAGFLFVGLVSIFLVVVLEGFVQGLFFFMLQEVIGKTV